MIEYCSALFWPSSWVGQLYAAVLVVSCIMCWKYLFNRDQWLLLLVVSVFLGWLGVRIATVEMAFAPAFAFAAAGMLLAFASRCRAGAIVGVLYITKMIVYALGYTETLSLMAMFDTSTGMGAAQILAMWGGAWTGGKKSRESLYAKYATLNRN